MSESLSELLDAAAVGQLLSVPKTWVLAQARAGKMPHVKLGHYTRFRRESVLAWVEGLETSGGPTAPRKHKPTVKRA